MIYKLNSGTLSVSINSNGAEISSMVFNSLEYIWQAKADVWARHAPVLFPIVGRLTANEYRFNQRKYTLPQHGFARDNDFKCILQNDTELWFELKSSEETKRVFPFEFQLIIKYTLRKEAVTCEYEVANPSEQNIYFSIGAHPGFKVPIEKHERFEDYKLKLGINSELETTVLEDGLLSEKKEKLPLQHGELELNSKLFDKDALVFEYSQIDHVKLISSKSGRGVELECKGWPYFGIWSKKGCEEFVCLEPWHGITDTSNSSGELKTKKGIIELNPGMKFNSQFSIRVF